VGYPERSRNDLRLRLYLRHLNTGGKSAVVNKAAPLIMLTLSDTPPGGNATMKAVREPMTMDQVNARMAARANVDSCRRRANAMCGLNLAGVFLGAFMPLPSAIIVGAVICALTVVLFTVDVAAQARLDKLERNFLRR
jgi:hypothetical protein